MRSAAVILVLGGLALSALAQPAPSPPALTIDDCRYADDAAAQAVWRPMRGSALVGVATNDGWKALRLACSFAGSRVERASWDRQVQLDLTGCQGVRFKILCRDTTPVSYFSLYFQSGNGWYHASFFPESSNGWNTITIDKAETTAEGRPAGWGAIRTLRISAWRSRDADTEFLLTDLRKAGVLGADASVAIVRGESAVQQRPGEARSVEQYTENIAEHLRALDLGCAVVSDLDLTADRLSHARVVVLPYNPGMPDRVASELARFVERGGKLVAFYTVPEKLLPLLGIEGGRHVQAPAPGSFSTIRLRNQALAGAPPSVNQRSWNIHSVRPIPGQGRVLADWLDEQGRPTGQAAVLGSTNGLFMTHVLLPDDPDRKRRLLLALVGHLDPSLWPQATLSTLARVGQVAAFTNLDEAVTGISQMNSNNVRVTESLAAARALRAAAQTLASKQRFGEAMDEAAKASQQVLQAFCLAQQPLPGEFRAFWCHSAFGVEGMTWDEAIRRLADQGFTAILPNMLWGGVAFYPSQVLPVSSQIAKRGDQIAQCLAACRRHGVQIHVWKVNWNLGSAAPQTFIDTLRRQGRLQAGLRGEEKLWLCPSHPGNQRLEIDSMIEMARRYAVDGLHFDYIRYPDGDHCFCAGCRERFQRATGARIRRWPEEALSDGPLRARWLDWRRSHITTVVRGVSEQARAVNPGLKLSAAVFRNWLTDRDNIGQDWKLWCDRGYLDFVCPMDYTPSKRSFDSAVAQQVEWTGRIPCFPGIGVSASSSRLGADRVIEQIQITRRHRTGGFVIFNYGVAESRDLLPLLGCGITAKR